MKRPVPSDTFSLFSSFAFILGFPFNMVSILWHSCFTKVIHYYLPNQTINSIQPQAKLSDDEEHKDKNATKFIRKELLGGDLDWIQDTQDILKLPSEDDFINHISRFDEVCSIDNLELNYKRRNNHYRLTTGVEVRDHPLRRSISAKEYTHECITFRKVIEEINEISRLQKAIEETNESSRLKKDMEEIEYLNESSRLQKAIKEINESSRFKKTMEDLNESSILKFTEEIEGRNKNSRLKMAMEDLSESSSRKKLATEEIEDLAKSSEYQSAVEEMTPIDFHRCSTIDNLFESKESIGKIKKVFNPEEHIPSCSECTLDYLEYIMKNKFEDTENIDDNMAEEETRILYGEKKNEDFKLKITGGDAKNSDPTGSSKSKESNADLEVLIDKINEIVDAQNRLEIVSGKLTLRSAAASESNFRNVPGTISGNYWKEPCNGEENKGFCASLSDIDKEESFIPRNINFSIDFPRLQQLPEKSPDDEDNFEPVSLSSSSSHGSEVELLKRHEKPPTFPAKMSALGRQAQTALSKSTNKMKIDSKASMGKLKARLKNL